jgi:hypothetical protein
MKESLIIGGGIHLIAVGLIFTIITFGLGAFCTGPLMFIGIILVIVRFIFPVEIKTIQSPTSESARYCTNCGRSIPFDARICPYCGKQFE